jgi:hypothetical protein
MLNAYSVQSPGLGPWGTAVNKSDSCLWSGWMYYGSGGGEERVSDLRH